MTHTAAPAHWSKQKELVRSYWHFRLLILCVRLLPLALLRMAALPVSFFYFLGARNGRAESRRFLDQMRAFSGTKKRRSTFKHIASFALSISERAKIWSGAIPGRLIQYQNDDIEKLVTDIEEKHGALLLCSHLGSAELLRALANFGRTRVNHTFPIISIVDFTVTENFNRMLRRINPDSMNHLINAGEVGVDTMERLQGCLAQGGLVVCAADRTTSREHPGRRFMFDFLGKPAVFPMGPFYIAALLKTHTYFCFGLREKTFSPCSAYGMHIHKSNIDFDCPRSERNARMEDLARSYAGTLESFCIRYPYQWYNYYNFWEAPA
ncbi:MAG: hypothetical protein LBR16_09885 [Treponema sp.]|nr:hypothetical protein [Treponema sp.]